MDSYHQGSNIFFNWKLINEYNQPNNNVQYNYTCNYDANYPPDRYSITYILILIDYLHENTAWSYSATTPSYACRVTTVDIAAFWINWPHLLKLAFSESRVETSRIRKQWLCDLFIIEAKLSQGFHCDIDACNSK